jgi:hypothetical protein
MLDIKNFKKGEEIFISYVDLPSPTRNAKLILCSMVLSAHVFLALLPR